MSEYMCNVYITVCVYLWNVSVYVMIVHVYNVYVCA